MPGFRGGTLPDQPRPPRDEVPRLEWPTTEDLAHIGKTSIDGVGVERPGSPVSAVRGSGGAETSHRLGTRDNIQASPDSASATEGRKRPNQPGSTSQVDRFGNRSTGPQAGSAYRIRPGDTASTGRVLQVLHRAPEMSVKAWGALWLEALRRKEQLFRVRSTWQVDCHGNRAACIGSKGGSRGPGDAATSDHAEQQLSPPQSTRQVDWSGNRATCTWWFSEQGGAAAEPSQTGGR